MILVCLSNFLDFLSYLQEPLQAATGTGSGLKGNNRLMHLFCKFHTRAAIVKYISINILSITGILFLLPFYFTTFSPKLFEGYMCLLSLASYADLNCLKPFS